MARRIVQRYAHTPSRLFNTHATGAGASPFDILYTNEEQTVYSWLTTSPSADTKAFGFDAEWKPCFQRGEVPQLATIQIATRSNAIVIQLNALIASPPGPASGCLNRFLSATHLTFAGMGIKQDFHKIRAEIPGGAEPSVGPGPSLVDLKPYGKDRGVEVPGGLLGLAQHLMPQLDKWKSKRLQLSNWARYPLSEDQVRYAGMDAWASLACYEALQPLSVVASSDSAWAGAAVEPGLAVAPAALRVVLEMAPEAAEAVGAVDQARVTQGRRGVRQIHTDARGGGTPAADAGAAAGGPVGSDAPAPGAGRRERERRRRMKNAPPATEAAGGSGAAGSGAGAMPIAPDSSAPAAAGGVQAGRDRPAKGRDTAATGPAGEPSASALLPAIERLSLGEFRTRFVERFGHGRWVLGAAVGQVIPRTTWPVGYKLNRLAEAAGLALKDDGKGGVALCCE